MKSTRDLFMTGSAGRQLDFGDPWTLEGMFEGFEICGKKKRETKFNLTVVS